MSTTFSHQPHLRVRLLWITWAKCTKVRKILRVCPWHLWFYHWPDNIFCQLQPYVVTWPLQFMIRNMSNMLVLRVLSALSIVLHTWSIMVGCPTQTKLWSILETNLHQQSLATGLHLKSELLTLHDVFCGWLPNCGPFHRPTLGLFPWKQSEYIKHLLNMTTCCSWGGGHSQNQYVLNVGKKNIRCWFYVEYKFPCIIS